MERFACIYISSNLTVRCNRGTYSYIASKIAAESIIRQLGYEYQGVKGYRFNIIAPGYFGDMNPNKREIKNRNVLIDICRAIVFLYEYEEVNVIEKSVQNFSGLVKYGINIYYVTAEKEHGRHTMKNVLREIIKRKKFEQNIHIIEYPYNTGVMAHQLNYAIEQFESNTICFVYNVDSVIDIRTIDYVIDNSELLDNGVFQQYSYSKRTSDSRIINSAILWQNRWMFAFELPKTIRSNLSYPIFGEG